MVKSEVKILAEPFYVKKEGKNDKTRNLFGLSGLFRVPWEYDH